MPTEAELQAEIAKLRASLRGTEQVIQDLTDEITDAREFIATLPALGCSIEMTVAIQEFLLGAEHIAGKRGRTPTARARSPRRRRSRSAP